ncbi:MAG: CoA-disulfide reductase [Bacteroidetes bacterium B1(2017)]|nr:MAG: CoA-disulfide reductase [Bacteroidetes bacterium B1(2017)]
MKYVIVGAVAGGASAAARLRRLNEHAEIVIFEKGAYISYANCGLPYYIGNVIADRNKLFVQTAAAFNARFNVDVRVQTEVTAINTELKTIEARNLQTGEVYTESYDKLLLSPGAEPIKPPLPGINLEGIFTLRNVTDTDYIKAWADKHKTGKAVVVGAGFIGLEMAENLHHLGMDVSVIEMGKQVMAPLDIEMAAHVQNHIKSKGVHLYLNNGVKGFEKQEKGMHVMLQDGSHLEADIVILSIGVKPDTKLATLAGLNLGPAKGIWVNHFLQTSNQDIYAVGDAIEFTNPITGNSMPTYLAGPANKQGRMAANNMVFGNKESYKGSINTAIVKVFDITVATAGMASKHLQASNIPHLVSTTHSGSHAGYYPGAQQMSIQLVFSPENGRVLGAQIVGYEGTDKRIEMLSAIIKNDGNLGHVTALEHAYAPPFSSAKDPVNMAGFVAENMLLKRMPVVYWNGLNQVENSFLVDVRTSTEFAEGHIPGAVNIPVDDIRQRLDEFKDKGTVIAYCALGQRGYLAQQILVQNNIPTLNLSGGYRTWSAMQ